MPKAHEIATELRKLADALDAQPEVELNRPFVSWHHYVANEKDMFTALAKLMPRPIKKSITGEGGSMPRIDLTYQTSAITIYTQIPQSATCELVEPAKPAVYRCDPILSQLEESELEASNG
jgi:hypothetical protein